ncbi:L-rhamnose-binding lectin CSL3-like [Centroberyx gerrardi]
MLWDRHRKRTALPDTMAHSRLYTAAALLLAAACVQADWCSKSALGPTCEGHSATLDCGSCQINVTSANYGRTDHRVCSYRRPASEITKTNCVLPSALHQMSKRCDGKTWCSVPAVNSIFTDPCVGTYKYLEVTYTCVPKRTLSRTCEGHTAILDCAIGVIKVTAANYGRTNSHVCSAGHPPHLVRKVNCILPSTLQHVAHRCNGKQWCDIGASNAVFGDPCYGTYKYLDVSYFCVA